MLGVMVAAIVVFLVFLVVHLPFFLLREVKARTRTMTMAMLVCTPLLWPAYHFVNERWLASDVGGTAGIVIFVIVAFTFLWFGYLQFYFSFERSPSLRFLVEIMESEGGALTPAELQARFSFEDVFRRRVGQMADVKLLLTETRDGTVRYFNSPKGDLVGRGCWWVKKAMRLGSGG